MQQYMGKKSNPNTISCAWVDLCPLAWLFQKKINKKKGIIESKENILQTGVE
jgi:hypothetical protein